jgi:SUF system for Fe-S cluster assembly SufBD-like protein
MQDTVDPAAAPPRTLAQIIGDAVQEGAAHAKSTVKCDALLVDTVSRSDTYPYVDVREDDVEMGHEANVSKISEDQLFYLMSRTCNDQAPQVRGVRSSSYRDASGLSGVGVGGDAGLRQVSSGQLSARAGAREEGEDFADGEMLAGFVRREVGLDLVAVAAAVFLLDGIAGRGQVGDDAVGAALGDAHRGRDVAQPHARVICDAQQDPGVLGQEAPALHASKTTTNSRNILLVFHYLCRLGSRHRRSAASGG